MAANTKTVKVTTDSGKFQIKAADGTPIWVRVETDSFPKIDGQQIINPNNGSSVQRLYYYEGPGILNPFGTLGATRTGQGAWTYEDYPPNLPWQPPTNTPVFGASTQKALSNKSSDAVKAINNASVNSTDGATAAYSSFNTPIKMTIDGARSGLGILQVAKVNPNEEEPLQPGLGGNPESKPVGEQGGEVLPSVAAVPPVEQPSTPITPQPQPEPSGPKITPTILRYPLANLDAASELGITYDYIKIKVVDHISSLDLGRLSGSVGSARGRPTDYGNQFVETFNQLPPTQSLSKAYFGSQETYAYIILPMQPNLSSTNSSDWGTDSANMLQLVAGSIFNSFYGGVGSKGLSFDQIGKLGNDIVQGAQSLIRAGVGGKQEIAAMLAGQTVGTNLLTRATGTVVNPNLEMLFNGPRLRTFNFTFDMTPRFKEEAKEIRKIIRILKKYMMPAQHESSAFLKSPKIFLLEYIYNGNASDEEAADFNEKTLSSPKSHPYLNKIKPCALTDLNVNYTPDGSYMTYRDGGSMTRYTLTMSFSEIEPVYQNDYQGDDFNPPDPGY